MIFLNRFAAALQSPMLLLVRLYWGWQFMETGWGKLQNLPKVIEFFASLGVPLPALNAPFVAGLELLGGALLALGLFSRPIALLLTVNMVGAYLLADLPALLAVFSDPDKFYAAAPFTFLCASLLVLLAGPGRLAVDSALRPNHDAA